MMLLHLCLGQCVKRAQMGIKEMEKSVKVYYASIMHSLQ